jgi:hypothetical protein
MHWFYRGLCQWILLKLQFMGIEHLLRRFPKKKKKEEENLKYCIELFQYTCNEYIINGVRTLVLIGTGCTGSCKYNYLMITTMTVSFIRMNSAHAPSRNKNNILMVLSYTTNHLLIKRPHKIVNPID